MVTFAVLVESVAKVTRSTALAVPTVRVEHAVLAFACLAVAPVRIVGQGVVVAVAHFT